MKNPEVQVELLLGKRVLDCAGEIIGRLEEIHAEPAGKDLVLREYIVGKAGFLERVAALPLRLRIIPFVEPKGFGKVFKIPWDKMDLRNPDKPRTTCRKSELKKVRPE